MRFALVAYLCVVLLLMLLEESLIFFPSKYPDGNWKPAGLPIEDAFFEAADGTRLHGWYLEHQSPVATILYAHGNAGHLAHRAEILRVLSKRVGARVMIFDYRGYGRSEGSPDEAGILQDARAARAWLAERAGMEPTDLVLLGESIGGAVMIDVAAREGARALVLEGAFTSLPDVAAYHYPWAPVRLFMHTRLDSRRKIASYVGPVLQSHGDADEVVPYRLGQALHAAVPGPDKEFLTFPGARHNDPPPSWYYDALTTFLRRVGSD